MWLLSGEYTGKAERCSIVKLYFSGIDSEKTLRMVLDAGGSHVLVTPSQWAGIESPLPEARFLDCGSYEYFKAGKEGNPVDYLHFAHNLPGKWPVKVAYDVIGDAERTMGYWREIFKPFYYPDLGTVFTPIYQWGAPRDHLSEYLDSRELVGIGGMVRLFRGGHQQKDKSLKAQLDSQRDRAIDELHDLCSTYPGRFHIFGINSLKAIDAVYGLAASGDTSKWLDGARYGYAIFRNTKTNKLSQAPAKFIPGWEGLDREGRCKGAVKTFEQYCNVGAA